MARTILIAAFLLVPLQSGSAAQQGSTPLASPGLPPAEPLQVEFTRLASLARPVAGPRGTLAGIPAGELFEPILALAFAGHGPALAWCARHLDQAPDLLATDPLLGAGLFAQLVGEHATQPWLRDPCNDPLTSLERAPDGVRAALAHGLADQPAGAAGEPLALLLRAAALAPRELEDGARSAEALALLDELLARYPDHELEPRARLLAWRLEHLAPGQTAPELALRDVDGNELCLSDRLGKLVLVDVWRAGDDELPARFERRRAMLQRLDGAPISLLGIGLAADETAFRRDLEELEPRWPVSFEGGPAGPALQAWRLDGGPTTLLIDAEGMVRAVGLDGPVLEQAIERLLAPQTASREPVERTGPAEAGPVERR